jgi:hypothetical protein
VASEVSWFWFNSEPNKKLRLTTPLASRNTGIEVFGDFWGMVLVLDESEGARRR